VKILRCQDISPTYCPFEIRAATPDAVIEQAIAHGKAAHGLTDDLVEPAMIALWRARMREAPV
jgi:predicted small metal-binding protein